MYRPLAILEEFEKVVKQKTSINLDLLKQAEAEYFGGTPEKFLKSIWFVFALIGSSLKENRHITSIPPHISRKKPALTQEQEIHFKVTNLELLSALEKISITPQEVRKRISDLEKFEIQDWIHNPAMWTLFEYPCIYYDEFDDGGRFFVPSPTRLLKRMTNFVTQGYFEFLNNKNIFHGKNVAFSLRGNAYEGYLNQILLGTNILKIPENSSFKGKKCDFIWEGESYVVLFEAKIKIRSNKDQTFLNSNSIVTSWQTSLTAVYQAKNTISALNIKKKVALVILTDESLAEQTSQFVRVAKKMNFLENKGIDAIAICRTSEIEYISKKRSADETYSNILNTWKSLNPDALDGEIHDYEFFNDSEKKFVHPYLNKYLDSVFIGLSDKINLFASNNM